MVWSSQQQEESNIPATYFSKNNTTVLMAEQLIQHITYKQLQEQEVKWQSTKLLVIISECATVQRGLEWIVDKCCSGRVAERGTVKSAFAPPHGATRFALSNSSSVVFFHRSAYLWISELLLGKMGLHDTRMTLKWCHFSQSNTCWIPHKINFGHVEVMSSLDTVFY